MMSEHFEELRAALQEIDAKGWIESSKPDLDEWTEAIRAFIAGREGFGTLSDDEITLIAERVIGPCPSTLPLDHLRTAIQQRMMQTPKQKLLGHWAQRLPQSVRGVAAFRSAGPIEGDEADRVERTLEGIRKRLDESDQES